jgi:hypothetical protein
VTVGRIVTCRFGTLAGRACAGMTGALAGGNFLVRNGRPRREGPAASLAGRMQCGGAGPADVAARPRPRPAAAGSTR